MGNIWVEYVARVCGDEPQAVVAERIGISQGTVSRWRSGTKVPTDAAVIATFATAYGRNPVEAFVAAGALTLAQADGAISQESQDMLVELGTPDDRPRSPQARTRGA